MIIGKKPIGTVAYVGRGFIHEPFMWSWTGLIQYANEFMLKPGEFIHWMRGHGSGQFLARNHCASMMLGEWLFMLDTDHTFDPDLLERMLYVFNRDDLDVLTGLYVYKDPPHESVVYLHDGRGYQHVWGFDYTTPRMTFQIDSAGAGCLLIRRRVFERIAAELREKPFNIIGDYGEDFSFFERLRKLGIKSYCCPSIQVKHLVQSEIGVEDFDPNAVGTGKELIVGGVREAVA